MISFTVQGKPVTQGSKRAFMPKGHARPVIVDDNPKPLRTWRSMVQEAAGRALDAGPIPRFGKHVPVAVRLDFTIEPPQSWSPKQRPFPSVKPDADKLARAVLDALDDAQVYVDDAQVVQLLVSKQYGVPAGVSVEIRNAL